MRNQYDSLLNKVRNSIIINWRLINVNTLLVFKISEKELALKGLKSAVNGKDNHVNGHGNIERAEKELRKYKNELRDLKGKLETLTAEVSF